MSPANEPLSESDTRAKLITPALRERGWGEELIRREVTPGEIIKTSRGAQRGAKQVDYLLSLPPPQAGGYPVAVALIEAKKNTLSPAAGMEQGKSYARECKRFNVPFIYSTNGHQFVEYDSTTGKQSAPQIMALFPAPQMLRERYEEYAQFSLEDEAAKPLFTQYVGGDGTRRYYQDAAIRAALEQIAYQEKNKQPARVLLNLATGAGKTFIAVNLLKRIDDAGKLRRALFLCDRDALRQQALAQFQAVFGNDVEIARRTADGNLAQNARIHIATYQTLGISSDADDAPTFAREHYPLAHFSHIIIDECHRSLRNDWADILSTNEQCVHIGLTATPRQIKDENDEDREISSRNIRYFGEPVYTYDLAQGAKDGYLALCEIHKSDVNIDETGLSVEEVIANNPINYRTGEPLTEEEKEELRQLYESTDYEDVLMLPDRVHIMCSDLFNKLAADGDPLQKTIIFCVRREHAEMVTGKLNNLYADWCRENNKDAADPYAFVCMSHQGADQLPGFRNEDSHHFIAATVDLLTTGVDIPAVRNIVFFCYLKSPIRLQQMIGRGARIDATRGKLSFTVYDYTNATDLLEAGGWVPPPPGDNKGGKKSESSSTMVQIEGLDVHISQSGNYIVTSDDCGVLVRLDAEQYRGRLVKHILQQVKTLDDLRAIWIDPQKRSALARQLRDNGVSVRALANLLDMKDYDDYDIIAESGYGALAMTRSERAEFFIDKNKKWLNGLPPPVAKVLVALVRQFAGDGGITELETDTIFDTPAVKEAGGAEVLLTQASNAATLLNEAKRRLFAA